MLEHFMDVKCIPLKQGTPPLVEEPPVRARGSLWQQKWHVPMEHPVLS